MRPRRRSGLRGPITGGPTPGFRVASERMAASVSVATPEAESREGAESLAGRFAAAAQGSNSSAAHSGQYRPTSASGPVVAYIRQRSFGSVQSRSHSRQRRSVEVATWRFSLSMASFSAKSASDPPRPMASPRSQDVGLGRPSAERPRAGLSAILRAPRRSGRVAEGGALLRRYGGECLHRGFESLLLRFTHGEVSEWPKERDWKSRTC
jgi:hypothetical protein